MLTRAVRWADVVVAVGLFVLLGGLVAVTGPRTPPGVRLALGFVLTQACRGAAGLYA
jgi:hypothetical protein